MLKLIITEDLEIYRNRLVELLTKKGIFEIKLQASNGIELLNYLENNTADIIVMDISMPKMDGIETTKKVTEKYPNLKVLVLSSFSDKQYYYKMIEAGAKGYVLKNGTLEELNNAIKIVAEGGCWFSPQLLGNLVTDIKDNLPHQLSDVTDNELNILREICKGHNSEIISTNLNLTNEKVNSYIQKLLIRTDCTNNSELVLYAIKHQLIEI